MSLLAEPIKINNFADLFPKYDYYIFDSDGTLLEMLKPLGDSIKVLDKIRELKKRIYIYSNNSKSSLEELVERYNKQNCKIIPKNELFTSSYIAARYIKMFPEIKSVYLIGSKYFKQILEAEGINVLYYENDKGKTMTVGEFQKCETTGIDAVVVGGDNSFNFYKMSYGSLCLQNGAKFIVSDNDPTFRFHGYNFPSSAFSSYPLELISEKEPIVVGKPSPLALDIIMKRDGIKDSEKSRILMIGDSISTDIMFGINSGIDTLLVMTGLATENILLESKIKPTYVMDKILLK